MSVLIKELKEFTRGINADRLRKFFKSGDLPEGTSSETLRAYKELAERAIRDKKNTNVADQKRRIEMISEALSAMGAGH